MDQIWIDVEQLILEVRERPILWDTSSDLYKDRLKKIKTWTDICGLLTKNFSDKSEEDQENISKLFELLFFFSHT